MAEPKVVATVVRVDGQVLARNADGEVRLLKAGDILREGEVVVTASGARVELAYADGGATSIPEDSSVLISEEMTEAARPDARAASVEDATIAQVIQAIETGQDLDQVLEDPAAGLAGGGAGEGSSFVRLLRISEEIGQTTFDFAEAQGGVIGEFDGGRAPTVAGGEDGDVPPPVVDLTLSVVAPPLTNDNTPVITGTTNAPAGSTVTVVVTDSAGTSQTLVVTVGGNGGFSAVPPLPLADGPYQVTALVTDAGGNSGSASAAGVVDTTATITVNLDDVSSASAAAASITGTTTGVEAGQTVTLQVTDGTGTVTVTAVVNPDGSYSTTADLSGLADGPLTVTATVSDAAGNPATATDTAALDTTAAITVSLDDVNSGNVAAAPITGTTAGVEAGQTVTLVITDGTATVTVTAVVNPDGSYSTTADLSGLADGPLTVTASVSDAAGNPATATDTAALDTSAAITVSLDDVNSGNLTAVPITGTTNGVEAGQTVTLVISDSDPSTPDVTISAIVNANGTYATTADLSTLTDGPLTVTAAVTDLAGNPAVDSDSGVKAIADVPILASIDDILILTPGSTVISTGGTDAVVIPGLGNSGDGVLQADLERELGLPAGYFDNRFNPSGPNVTDDGFVNALDGKVTGSHYAMTAGSSVSWDYIFTNGENLTAEVSRGFNDLVVLVVTDPAGNKQSILVNASEVKFPASSISDTFTFTATSSGQYSFEWVVLNGGDRLKDSSLQLAAPSFRAPGDSAAYGAPVRLPVFAELADKSGSEVLSVVISGIPSGARFTSGTDNGDGSWSFTAAELGNLLLMPPAGFSGTLALTVTATALETANGDTAVTHQTVSVTFDQTDFTVTTGTSANQSINGTNGDDLIRGYAGRDTIDAREGDDLVFGGADNDTLRGGGGNDWLYGGQGNDTVYGDAGNDVLVGGAGDDNLYGGVGADVFKWQLGDQGSTSAPAIDVVKDFSVAQGDVLDLRDLLAGEAHQGVSAGNLSEYLDFNFEPGSGGSVGTTVVSVKTQGAAMSAPDQIIRLENVDLLEGLTDDNQIIQKLLSNGRLITD